MKITNRILIFVFLLIIFIVIFLIINNYQIYNDSFSNKVSTYDYPDYGNVNCYTGDTVICGKLQKDKKWEIDLSKEIEKYYKPNTLFLSIGASYGIHSLYIGNLIAKRNQSGKVYAFEAQPKIYELLQKNIRINNLENIIIAKPFGLGNKNCRISFLVPKDYDNYTNPGSISVKPLNYDNKHNPGKIMMKDEGENYLENSEEEQANIKTLDSLKLDNISVIRLDVNGYELEVLEGAIDTLYKNKPYIFLVIWESHFDKYKEWINKNLGFYNFSNISGIDYLLSPK